MIRKLFLLSLLANVWTFAILPAQRSYRYDGGTKVLAPSGLNMRATPGLKAKRIGAIPYGENVEIVDTLISVFDTVDYVRTLRNGEPIKYPIIGGWIKVKYQQKVGYVFSGLIGNFSQDGEGPEIMIRDVGFACEYIGYDMSRYHWYGLFPGKQHTEIRKINPTIYEFGEALPETIYTSGENEPCLMLIASLKPLPAESLKRPGGLPVSLSSREKKFKDYHNPTFSIVWQDDIQIEDVQYKGLVMQLQGKEFPLEWNFNSGSRVHETLILRPSIQSELVFHGDINNDGYLDIIVRVADDYGKIYLFYGGPKRLHDVAYFAHTPCC